MKEKETKSVKKQNSIFEYGKKHGFSFSWDRSVIEKIIFLALYFGTILIVHLVFKIQSITEIYMILLVTIPFAVYSYCKVVDGGKFDIKEVLNSCIRIGFVFSTVSLLLFVDLYYEFVNTSVVIVDLVVLILCFAYLGITKERKITLKLLLLPLLIFVVFIASVNVIRASTLVNEVIIILIVITLLYFLRMVTRRYFVVWNVCYFVTLIAFVLCLPFMFSNNHDESVFERSNYLDFEDTVFPSDFNQIIELNGFTYLLSEDKVSVYLDDDFKKEYLFSEKRATMFVDDNTLFLHLIDSDYQNNMSVVKILEVNEEEMSLIHRLELAEDPATIGVLTEDLYYYMDWDSKARVYDLLSDEDKEVELLEDESYVYNDSVMMELTYQAKVISSENQFGRVVTSRQGYFFTVTYEFDRDIFIEDIIWEHAVTFDDRYIYLGNGSNGESLYNKETNLFEESLVQHPMKYVEKDNLNVYYGAQKRYKNNEYYDIFPTLVFRLDNRTPQSIWVPVTQDKGTDIRISNSNEFYYFGKKIVFLSNEDIVYYDIIPETFHNIYLFISVCALSLILDSVSTPQGYRFDFRFGYTKRKKRVKDLKIQEDVTDESLVTHIYHK